MKLEKQDVSKYLIVVCSLFCLVICITYLFSFLFEYKNNTKKAPNSNVRSFKYFKVSSKLIAVSVSY